MDLGEQFTIRESHWRGRLITYGVLRKEGGGPKKAPQGHDREEQVFLGHTWGLSCEGLLRDFSVIGEVRGRRATSSLCHSPNTEKGRLR